MYMINAEISVTVIRFAAFLIYSRNISGAPKTSAFYDPSALLFLTPIRREIEPMGYFEYVAITAYFTISALVSIHKEWFGFIYGIPGRDQVVRFVGMGLLSFFMVPGLSYRITHGRPLNPLVIMAIATLLVALDEFGQTAIPSRTFSLDDLALSFAGVLVFRLASAGIGCIRRLRSGSTS
jgi:hypothetical protein